MPLPTSSRSAAVMASALLLAAVGRTLAQEAPVRASPDTSHLGPQVILQPTAPDSSSAAYWRRASDSLNALNPAAMADSALARGDHRLLGLSGFTMILPGVPDSALHRYRDRLGAVAIPGTSDGFQGAEHLHFQEAAHRYAQAYNRRLLRRLGLRTDSP